MKYSDKPSYYFDTESTLKNTQQNTTKKKAKPAIPTADEYVFFHD
jgi:hypothetical protein